MDKFLQLAPMQAMTDVIFMNTYHEIFGGFTEMMAPYLLASTKSPIKEQRLQKYFGALNPEIKMIPQLLSNEAEGFLHYANLLYDQGFDTVNWNLGCPFPFVTKKHRGAGLLPFPEKIEEVLEGMYAKLKPQLSIKIRLGYYHPDEIQAIIPILNRYPLKELIIHPRTAVQKYEGEADKKIFRELYPQLNMPIIYNGDIIRNEQVFDMEKIFQDIKGYMIGRGAFINPFITNQINGRDFTEKEKREKYRTLYYALHQHYKEKTINNHGFLSRMKELWSYFSQSFEKGESYFFALKIINDVDIFEESIDRIFSTGKLLY